MLFKLKFIEYIKFDIPMIIFTVHINRQDTIIITQISLHS